MGQDTMSHLTDMNDHDLLITIHAQLQRALMDIDDLRKTLVKEKMDKTDAERLLAEANLVHQDHETRIRKVETWGWRAIGIIGAIQFAIMIIGAFRLWH